MTVGSRPMVSVDELIDMLATGSDFRKFRRFEGLIGGEIVKAAHALRPGDTDEVVGAVSLDGTGEPCEDGKTSTQSTDRYVMSTAIGTAWAQVRFSYKPEYAERLYGPRGVPELVVSLRVG